MIQLKLVSEVFMHKYIALLFLLVGCQMGSDVFEQKVINHELLLREHFLGHSTEYDMAGLINMTTEIANQLRGRGRLADANRFDSYRDVLIYGNLTIDESMNDVKKLIHNGVPNYCEGFWQSIKNLINKTK